MDPDIFDEYLQSIEFSRDSRVHYFDVFDNTRCPRWICGDELGNMITSINTIDGHITSSANDFPSSLHMLSVPSDDPFGPTKITKNHFLQAMQACRFPPRFVQTLSSNNGHVAHFTEYEGGNVEYLSMIFTLPYTPLGSQSYAIQTRFEDGVTVCISFRDNEAGINLINRRLQMRRGRLHHSPPFFIFILAEEYGRQIERLRQRIDGSIVRLETRLGKSGWRRIPAENPRGDDFDLLVRDMQAVNTSLIWLDAMTNFEMKLYRFSTQMVSLFEDLKEERGGVRLDKAVMSGMQQEIQFCMNECELRRYQANGLHQRIQTQINLLYSELSQRDNRLNISVAQDSRRIASATLGDSRVMKTIAAVTLLFLPANLIASIFSAGIINVNQDRIILAKYWWMYAICAIVITVFVILVWVWFMRMKGRKILVTETEVDVEKSTQMTS